MKKAGKLILPALLFASVSLSAFAEAPQQRPGEHQQQQKPLPQDNQQGSKNQGEKHNDKQHAGKSLSQSHGEKQQNHKSFQKGRPLPQHYRGESYQVSDWRQRGLQAPPAGHRWQNVDGNYVLIALATGIITSVITHQ